MADSTKLRSELNFFYYDFSNFVFPFATGEIEDGLRVIEFTQRNARFYGAESAVHLALLLLGTALVGFNEEALTRGVLVVAARGSTRHEAWVWLFSVVLDGCHARAAARCAFRAP